MFERIESIYDATYDRSPGGRGRQKVVGKLVDSPYHTGTYLFKRPTGTLSSFAAGVPVKLVDGKWEYIPGRTAIVNWMEKIVVLEVEPTIQG